MKLISRVLVTLALLFLLTSCSSVKQQPTLVPTLAWPSTATPAPVATGTSASTLRPVPTNSQSTELSEVSGIAANYVETQVVGQVEVQLIRVLCMDPDDARDKTNLNGHIDSVRSACEFILRITNNSGQVVNIFPDQGKIIVNSEQIDPWEYHSSISDMEYVSDEIYPGVTRFGGFWFGVRRSTWNQIKQMTYIIDEPCDENYNALGEKYHFEIDMSNWGFEPLPENLEVGLPPITPKPSEGTSPSRSLTKQPTLTPESQQVYITDWQHFADILNEEIIQLAQSKGFYSSVLLFAQYEAGNSVLWDKVCDPNNPNNSIIGTHYYDINYQDELVNDIETMLTVELIEIAKSTNVVFIFNTVIGGEVAAISAEDCTSRKTETTRDGIVMSHIYVDGKCLYGGVIYQSRINQQGDVSIIDPTTLDARSQYCWYPQD